MTMPAKSPSKNSISVLRLFASILFFFAATSNASISLDGLVAHYNFDGNTADLSGNIGEAIAVGAVVTSDRHGNPTGAFELDGVDDYIDLGHDPSLNAGPAVSVSLWAALDNATSGSLISKVQRSSYALAINSAATNGVPSTLDFGVGNNDLVDYWDKASTNSAVLADGSWHHVVGTYDGATIKIYIDGALSATKQYLGGLEGNDQRVLLGAEPGGPGGDISYPFLDGKLDDLMIFNRALSEQEVVSLYSNNAGPIAYYPFDGNADDASGHGNNGIPVGATLTSDRFGNPDSAYHFNGGSYIRVPDSDYLEAGNVGTVTLWAYLDATPGGYSDTFIAKYMSESNYEDEWLMYVDTSNGIVAGTHAQDGNYTRARSYGYELGKWFHVAATFDGGTTTLYVDGQQVGSTVGSVVYGSGTNYDMLIGANRNPYLGPYNYFKGKIDDISIYSYALSADELLALYEAEAPPTIPDIDVDHISYDFGVSDVTEDGYREVPLTISNAGGGEVVVSDISFFYDIQGEPFTFFGPEVPFAVSPGTPVEIWVRYTPSFLDLPQSNVLLIASDDADEPTIEIEYTGTGVVGGDSPEAVKYLAEYVERAVSYYMIEGVGAGNSASNKLKALQNMIDAAGDLLDAGDLEQGCEQLWDLYKKTDGEPNPPDFVTGEAVGGINNSLWNLMVRQGCSQAQ